MIVITKANDVIIAIAESVNEDRNFIEINHNTNIPKNLVKGIYEVKEIPKEVKPLKYCCIEGAEFHLNPNYKENYSSEERIAALEDAVNILLGF